MAERGQLQQVWMAGRRFSRGIHQSLGLARLLAFLAWSARRSGPPRAVDLAERLAALPTAGLPLSDPVEIRWTDQQIPFVTARSDRDLAVALGVVHAHLRLAQIDFMRRIATGRLSEALGPVAVELDHALRIIDFRRAGRALRAAMSPDSLAWMEAFREGLNAQIATLQELPHEFRVLDLAPEAWSLDDLLAVSRLASTDFTWVVWLRLLKLRNRTDWPQLWERLVSEPALPEPSLSGSSGGVGGSVLAWFGRPGSNSYAVSGARSASGSPLIANDPHLTIGLPNLWLIAGMQSPSYHAVGLMVPGVPVLGLGRTPRIAWGGTNLHAASSELVDVSALPPSAIRTRSERIRVRWTRARTVSVRETDAGPVLSDARLLWGDAPGRVALHWMGHRPSDEISAFLGAARAGGWRAFRSAMRAYAIPALNLVYADADGHIGEAMAARLPARPHARPDDIVSPPEAMAHWSRFHDIEDLPARLDPPEGFVASANNAPPRTEIAISLFFSPDDRVNRLREILSGPRPFARDDFARIQQDVAAPGALNLRDRLLSLVADQRLSADAEPVSAALRSWDGHYDADSSGALAFELVLHRLFGRLRRHGGRPLFEASWRTADLLLRDLGRLPAGELAQAVAGALVDAQGAFVRLTTWGAAHCLRLAHPLANIPRIGRRYVFADLGSAGGNETLMKMAHGSAGGRHRVRFGANARHISDLADPDENHFVLLGGQDGWLGSANFVDQLELWSAGRHVRLPLRRGAVESAFPHVTMLRPDPQAKPR